jgi:hydroxymethylglutaryl-CoA lyase
LANVFAAAQLGVSVFDCSIGGLGGCPYAKGATGNVATEDVAFMLNGLGVRTGIDMSKLVETSNWICNLLSRSNGSRFSTAVTNQGRLPFAYKPE